MKRQFIFLVCAASIGITAYGTEQGNEDVTKRLTFAELNRLTGSWEMKLDPKTGWNGMIYLYIGVGVPGGKNEGFCTMRYDAKLISIQKTIFVKNAAGPGVSFAGVKQGEMVALVTQPEEGTRFAPFQVKATPALMAPFTLDGKKLTLDMSKSAKYFLPKPLAALDLDWSKTEWTRSDKVRKDK